MNTTYHKFLIFSAIVLILGGVYTYFSNGLNAQAETSALASSAGTTSALGGALTTNDQISQDTAFLATLTSLTKIKIDTSIFNDSTFNSLSDNTVILEPGVAGRENPFAPITAVTPAESQNSPVTTNDATQVTSKSAVLNGTIESDTAGVTSTYFEYGATPATLTKTTAPVKQSLIGTFVTSLNNLNPKTIYFYHAVAKINGTFHYGEVVSFTTN